jgi:hypothetical protein
MPRELLERFREAQVIPVVRTRTSKAAAIAVGRLCDPGLRSFEITMTVPDAPALIRDLARDQALLVGAGTVPDAAAAPECLKAGAKFIVAPSVDPALAAPCRAASAALPPCGVENGRGRPLPRNAGGAHPDPCVTGANGPCDRRRRHVLRRVPGTYSRRRLTRAGGSLRRRGFWAEMHRVWCGGTNSAIGTDCRGDAGVCGIGRWWPTVLTPYLAACSKPPLTGPRFTARLWQERICAVNRAARTTPLRSD